MWGKSGHFAGRVLYATVNGRQLRLTGVFDDKGTAGGVGAVATSVVLIQVAGFFMTGTSAKLEMGTPVKASMDEDVQLAIPAAVPQPLVVGTPPAQPLMAAAPAPTMRPAVARTVAASVRQDDRRPRASSSRAAHPSSSRKRTMPLGTRHDVEGRLIEREEALELAVDGGAHDARKRAGAADGHDA